MQSAAPVETLERRGSQQELEKVSMENSRLFHTLHSADEGYRKWGLDAVLGTIVHCFHPLKPGRSP